GREIATNAPVAIAAAKASIDEAYDLPMDAALEMERLHYEKALLSEDRLEGLKAFAEKRPPRWTGKEVRGWGSAGARPQSCARTGTRSPPRGSRTAGCPCA